MPYPSRPIADRLACRTDRRGPNECWLWLGATLPKGYGVIGSGGKHSTNRYVHRVAYELAHGPIPADLAVDHTCHSYDKSCRGGPTCEHRRCVNPAHLEVVTPTENNHRSRTAKVTMEAVRSIRQAAAAGVPNPEIAAVWGIDRSEVSKIVCGRIWTEEGMVVRVPRRSS
jgi:hypothetical protein